MKSKECKQHNHKLTHFLKVFIYMLVMLAPFFAIGVKCWYVATNKNANESYRGSYQFDAMVVIDNTANFNTYQTYTTVNSNELTIGNTFGARGGNESNSQKYTILKYEATDGTNEYSFDSTNYNYDYYMIYGNGNIMGHSIELNTNDRIGNYLGAWQVKYGEVQLYSLDVIYAMPVDKWQYPSFIIDNTLSSVFYSAVQELDGASIFSWTTNTGIYTAINNMCVALGIVSPPLAVLLTYWSLITAIYIVIDIVIETFTFLTHWFTDKMV